MKLNINSVCLRCSKQLENFCVINNKSKIIKLLSYDLKHNHLKQPTSGGMRTYDGHLHFINAQRQYSNANAAQLLPADCQTRILAEILTWFCHK